MDQSEHTPERLQARGEGLGEISGQLLQRRARELAAMDSREEPNAGDIAQAREELSRMTLLPDPPEAPAGLESVTVWDEPPAASGHQAPKILPEDEANIGEALVEEGLEEAEHDQRLAAADTEPEPGDPEKNGA